MSEEIKKGVQDVELNPEDLDRVVGGEDHFSFTEDEVTRLCIKCGAVLIKDGQGNYRCPNGPHYEKPTCPYCGSENMEYIPQAHMTICYDCEREF
ncbi:MAG: hypothetical protein IJ747_07480 [Lachnospiraceae bacterium]|nr:hypothetical protein [Lachnospiraceae bacterium]MBR1853225.1 hypothetical protein [Lachnospiraceae bacterium]